MNRLLLSLLLTTFLLLRAEAYTALDPSSPVALTGDAVKWRDVHFTPSPHCLYVDMQLTDEYMASHPFTFRSFNDAMAAVTDSTTVYIAPGVYWVDDPDEDVMRTGKNGREPFGLEIECNSLRLVGLTDDARNVVICAARGHTQGAWGNFTMLDITGDDFYAENLTLGNFCNVDLEFPLTPSLGRKKRNKAITQAHVGYLHGDRAMMRNVRFISRLNMNPLSGARRVLYDRCHMESTDDALAYSGVYLNCTLDFYAPKPFWNTHPDGAVFLNCDFTVRHQSGRQYFCKSVGQVSVIDSRYHTTTPTYPGWTHYPTAWLRSYQSNVQLDGRPVTIGAERPENTVDITDLPLLDAFRIVTQHRDTVYNTFSLLRGDDNWDPMGVADVINGHSKAKGRDVSMMATHLGVTPREVELTDGDGAVTLRAIAHRHAGFDAPKQSVKWAVADSLRRFIEILPAGDSCVVRSINTTDTAVVIPVVATTAEGLQGVALITARPALLAAPEVSESPVIAVDGKEARLDYTLSLDGRDDRSEITWYRATLPDLSDGRPIAVSRYGKPLRSLPLTAADAGRYLYATLSPAHIRSVPAEPIFASAMRIDAEFSDSADVLSTDFSNFPTVESELITPGFWTVGGYKPSDTEQFTWADESGEYWYYGTGINGATGRGLSQRRKGARLMYTPLEGRYGDMSVTLLVDPAKTAGQGFGSATGQYLDVALKFDTVTLTGYALRIIRTTKHSNAVDFMLMEYSDGTTRPISEAVSAACYRTGCTISLRYEDGMLTADVTTATPLKQPDDPEVMTEVHISAPVAPNPYGGIVIQHTGSTGEGATMLHSLDAQWKREPAQ